MTLMLHCGAEEVSVDDLRTVETPEATKSHVPIPHHRLVDMLRHTLSYYGHEVIEEHHGTTLDGMRYFGILLLKSTYGGYEDAVALRNSHDKSFPIGIGFGGHVFCCDNMSLIADQVIRRKHTVNAKRDLPAVVAEMVEPLADAREAQQKKFKLYKSTPVSDQLADHLIMEMWKQKVINIQRIAVVYNEWELPSFEEFGERNCWRLFNAATFALNGKVVANPQATQTLHHIIDDVAERHSLCRRVF